MTKAIEKKAPPIGYLRECSDSEVGNYELARLAEVANLRDEMFAMFDRIVDVSSLCLPLGFDRLTGRS